MAETPAEQPARSRRDHDGSGPSAVGSDQERLVERDEAGRVTSRIRTTTLPSGMRVVTEEMAGARSASVGVWVAVGSRDETPAEHGCSHFLEHVLFKGTERRSALEISVALDAVGGELNAFTAKEYTCFHARVLAEDLPLAVDVLGDMVTGSLLTPADVEAERDVILDEIAMHEDDPDDVVHTLFAEQAWGASSPLGRSIAGTEQSISALTRDDVADFLARHYRPASMVVAAAGRVQHDLLVEQVATAFGATASWTRRGRRTGRGRAPFRSRCWPGRSEPSGGSSRPTSCSAPGGWTGTTSAASPSACWTPPSGAAPRAGCSRRCGSVAGWPTRSTRSRPTTLTAACSGSVSGACPSVSTLCSTPCARS